MLFVDSRFNSRALQLALPSLVLLTATTGAAHGGIAYGLESSGALRVFDSSTPSVSTVLTSVTSFADGLAVGGDGSIWVINWSGSLWHVDPVSGVKTNRGLVSRPQPSGFFKDMAWDPVGNRLVATFLGSGAQGQLVNSLLTINTDTAVSTTLGQITGLQGFNQTVLTLAIDQSGRASVGNYGDGYIYDVGTLPSGPVGTLAAVRRSVQSVGGSTDFRGMAFDPESGALVMTLSSLGPTARQIAPDGSSTPLANWNSVPYYADIAFVANPVPSAGTAAAALLGLSVIGARRRRNQAGR